MLRGKGRLAGVCTSVNVKLQRGLQAYAVGFVPPPDAKWPKPAVVYGFAPVQGCD